jgi:hypothetical protein
MNRAALACLALLSVARPLSASLPPLPLPAWIRVDLRMDRAPELDGSATVKLTLTALLEKLPAVKYELDLPRTMEVAGGAKSGTVDLEPGKPAVLEIPLHARGPVDGGNVSVDVTTRPPRSALRAEVERSWNDQKDAGVKLIAALPPTDVQRRFVGLTVTPDESFLATASDPAYRHPIQVGDARFLLLDAIPGMDAKAVAGRLATQMPRLERFRKMSTGRQNDPLTRLVSDLTSEVAKLRYQQAVFALASGKPGEVPAILTSKELTSPELSPTFDHARKLALAVAAVASGDTAGALQQLDALDAAVPAGPPHRYVDLARGEIFKMTGKTSEARAAYRKAVEVAPSFTLAKRRLAELK